MQGYSDTRIYKERLQHFETNGQYEANDCLENKTDLSELSGKNISLKFYLTDGDLYSFWISSWKTGESGGYTAGGGPGLNPAGVDIK